MREFIVTEASDHFSNTAKFIFVAVDTTVKDLRNIFSFFFGLKILNVVIILSFDNRLSVYSYNPLAPISLYRIDKQANIDLMFPDKLKNLHGYNYKVICFNSPPRLRVKKQQIKSMELMFMNVVAEKMNARRTVSVIEGSRDEKISEAFFTGAADVCLNTGMYSKSKKAKIINTYDTDGFCVLVPIPAKNSQFDFIYKPFDLCSWIWILLSMTCCAIVWHFLQKLSTSNSSSAGHFVFAFISNFLGQLIPFRAHHPMQKLIMQLSILMTFILGTAYQSIIVASFFDSRFGRKITTMEELIGGDYFFYADKIFTLQLNESEYYQRMSPRITIMEKIGFDFKNLSSQNTAIILMCSLIDAFLDDTIEGYGRNAGTFYYKLDEKFNSFYLKFPLARYTFFSERLQEMSLRIFESGVK